MFSIFVIINTLGDTTKYTKVLQKMQRDGAAAAQSEAGTAGDGVDLDVNTDEYASKHTLKCFIKRKNVVAACYFTVNLSFKFNFNEQTKTPLSLFIRYYVCFLIISKYIPFSFK